MSEMSEAIHQLMQEKGYSEDSVKEIITGMLKAAYKRAYGTDENAIVKFSPDLSDVAIYSRKTVVDGVYDPVTEIELEDVKEYDSEVAVGDEIDMLEDPKTFDMNAVRSGKQRAREDLRAGFTKRLRDEYKSKIGEIIVCYAQYERNGDIFCDLGNAGKVEGKLPKKFQSEREHYGKGDRIKARVEELADIKSGGLQVILSRTSPELVRAIVEMEVPEVADGTIVIERIARDPGKRTKIAVSSTRDDVDPVGACVGLKGARIQNVIAELEGEKIDVLRYDADPTVFIANALSPAHVKRVVILDIDMRKAVAVVDEDQLSMAIGKSGQNSRLAGRLCDWSIDVKSEKEAADMDLPESAVTQTAQSLFSDDGQEEGERVTVAELPGVDSRVAEILKSNGVETVEQFVEANENGSLRSIPELSQEAIDAVAAIVEESVEFVEPGAEEAEGGDGAQAVEEEYHCPECGAVVTIDMTRCPNCGAEFEFKEQEQEE